MRTCLALDRKDNPEGIAQHEKCRQPEHVWPEIPAGIRAVGLVDRLIYRMGTRLFVIVETADGVDLTAAFEQIGQLPRQAEWAALMNGFQQRLAKAKPGEHWAMMKPIFSLNS